MAAFAALLMVGCALDKKEEVEIVVPPQVSGEIVVPDWNANPDQNN